MSAVRAADRHGLLGFDPGFSDERLGDLLLRYKARNFPQSLTGDERAQWEEIRGQRLQKDMPAFTKGLAQLAASATDEQTQFLLQELQLWAESIVPLDD
jgi:exodeoxyribonuclease-1